ncbi:MAG: hypothetical protein QNI99_11350 [Woeseiaceae bacterium]|nr:hypothetical protein [Woeseiaceae bacterium]
MIRQSIAIVSLAAFPLASVAEDLPYFEGTVTMHVEIEAILAGAGVAESYWIQGTEQIWTYARGDFRIDYTAAEVESVWYKRDENREYSARVCDDFVTWVDVSEPFMTIVSVRQTGLEREIAGHKARAIDVYATVDDMDYSTRYWYAPSIPVNPEWFSEDRFGNFAALYEHIDSLIVGIEFQTQFSAVRRYATEIEFRPVNDEELALPDMPMRQVSVDEVVEGQELCPMPAAN